MIKNTIDMGEYYRASPYGLVKTICRGTDCDSGDSMIAYVNVNQGGLVSEVYLMKEKKFENIFLN